MGHWPTTLASELIACSSNITSSLACTSNTKFHEHIQKGHAREPGKLNPAAGYSESRIGSQNSSTHSCQYWESRRYSCNARRDWKWNCLELPLLDRVGARDRPSNRPVSQR